MSTETLTAERVRDLFHVTDDGELVWSRNGKRSRAGAVAGWVTFGRRKVGIDGRTYRIDQIVWLYHKGEFPRHFDLTHRDGDLLNCHIDNLVDMQPPSRKTHKTLDLPLGVSRTRAGNYVVRVVLGTFTCPLKAAMVYAEAMALTEHLRNNHGVPVIMTKTRHHNRGAKNVQKST